MHDEELVERVRQAVDGEPGLSEKRMFGGHGFLVAGHLAVSASSRGGLLVRIDPQQVEELTAHPHVRRFEMRGRAMNGWLHVDEQAVTEPEELERWVDVGIRYARTLPPK